jgi:hypothetical protein
MSRKSAQKKSEQRIKGEIACTARSGGETSDLSQHPFTKLSVPIRDGISDMQGIGLGFRMGMLSVGDKNGERGSLSTGTGLGSDAIILEWRGRRAVIRGRDLFKAWVATFAPEDVERMP